MKKHGLGIGLKLWSSNNNLLVEAESYIKNRTFDYIELTPVPGTSIEPFLEYELPYQIHITTEKHGVNIGDKGSHEYNLEQVNRCLEWADEFGSVYAILHPGFGEFGTAIDFLDHFDDRRITIENNPKIGINEEQLIGYDFEEIRSLINNRFGFCLDLNHAVKASISLNIGYKEFITALLKLNPKVFHISDGNLNNEKDEHLNIGEGQYDLIYMKDVIRSSDTKIVTLETPKTNDLLINDIKNRNKFVSL